MAMAANPRPQLTRQFAWAAATDAGNRSMRKGGRKAWSRSDYNTAVTEFNRLWPAGRDSGRLNPAATVPILSLSQMSSKPGLVSHSFQRLTAARATARRLFKGQPVKIYGAADSTGKVVGYGIFRENSRGSSARKNQGVFDQIRSGSRVTIVNRFGQQRTGRAVMRGPAGWVLNMGGPHGTPDIATPQNVVRVTKGRGNPALPAGWIKGRAFRILTNSGRAVAVQARR